MKGRDPHLWMGVLGIVLFLIGTYLMAIESRSRPTKPEPDHRLERACADVMLKQRLADAWEHDPARADDAKLIEVTIAGVLAICAEVQVEKP